MTGPLMDARSRTAAAIMTDFARRTGLAIDPKRTSAPVHPFTEDDGAKPSTRPGRRYLWTDAFAVCNYLGLAESTGEESYRQLALKLIDGVHHTLGMHRPDDRRTGWISGLDACDGEAHPTRGGLRIGKVLPERRPGEPFDERLEWERDGQYFHYLTKWMLALDRATRSTGEATFNVWARELAETAHRAFTHAVRHGARRRLYWKMSIDLSRPVVSAMGQHDALDGYLTCAQLRATAARMADRVAGPTLDEAMADFDSMIDRGNLATADPLGLGGLLADVYRLAQLSHEEAFADVELKRALLEAALVGLEAFASGLSLAQGASDRLAFRELGLAIGLEAAGRLAQAVLNDRDWSKAERDVLAALSRFDALRAMIVGFWVEPDHRRTDTWTAHRDINDVMLATALVPEGFLLTQFRTRSYLDGESCSAERAELPLRDDA